MSEAQSSPARGVFWMVVTGLCFVAVTAIVKHLGESVPAAQGAFLRYLLGLVFLIPMIGPIRRARLTARQLKLFGVRGLVHAIAVILWFYAMARLPIAEVTAMNYLSPVYVSLGGALILGESLPPRRLAAVIVALVGAVIILRPGVKAVESGHLAMLAVAVCFAAGYLIAKRLSDEVDAAVVVGMLSITVTIGLAPFAIAVWAPVTWTAVAWLFGVAFFATAGHYAMTLAFKAAPLTVTQPVTFLQLVWAVLLGWLVFGEGVDLWVILGGGLILGAVSFLTWREARARRVAAVPAITAAKGT